MEDQDAYWITAMQGTAAGGCFTERTRHRADTIWLVVMGGRIIAMQSGFAMVEAAFVRPINAANIMMKNLMDMFLGGIAFFYVGWRIAFPDEPQCEESGFDFALFFLHFSYATTAATIDSGALAGRVSFTAYLMLSTIMTGVIYPVVVNWAWGGGWLQEEGYVDFAGSSIVHVVGAASAFMCICICGPRVGRYPKYRRWRYFCKWLCLERYDDEYYQGPLDDVEKRMFASVMPIHNPVQALFGLFLLIVGFLAFNPASTLATTDNNDLLAGRATVTTLLAASGGASASFVAALYRRRALTVSIPEFTTMTIAGMVASCANCHAVPPSLSLLVGVVGGLSADLTQSLLNCWQLDDVVGAVAAHGPPGLWGVICVPLFAKPHCQSDLTGLVFGGGDAAWKLLRVQIYGVAAITAFTMVSTYVCVVLIDLTFGFRSDRATEFLGHDYVEHAFLDTNTADVRMMELMQKHSPARDCVKQRIKQAHSPTKPYDPKPELPPPHPDNTTEIAALKQELQSFKEEMRIIRAQVQGPNKEATDSTEI